MMSKNNFISLLKNIFILYFLVQSVMLAQDYSTPRDGNLYIKTSKWFRPNKIKIYQNNDILDKNSLVLKNNRIYSKHKIMEKIELRNKTQGSDIIWIDEKSYVVLTGRTSKYPHAILGDAIESTGFEVYSGNKLVGKHELSNNRVYETLRATVADIVPENPGKEIILTSSNELNGSRVELYKQTGDLLGASVSIGQGYRWLHILGAATFDNSSINYLAMVKTPHIGGKLELLTWNGESLVAAANYTYVSTHRIGSKNLNMAMLINADTSIGAEIILPTIDFRSLIFIKYTENRLVEINRFDLPEELLTNLYFDNADSPSIWFALSDGRVARIFE